MRRFWTTGVVLALGPLVGAVLPSAAQEAEPEGHEDEVERRIEVRVLPGRIAALPAGLAEGGYLGVAIRDVDARTASGLGLPEPGGVRVESVREDSPAGEAGLREGDVLLVFDGEKIRSVAALTRMVRETPPGRRVELDVLRDGERHTVRVEIGERPGLAAGAFRLDAVDRERARAAAEQAREQADRVRERMEDLELHIAPGVVGAGFGPGFGAAARLGVRTTPLTDQLADYFGVGGRGGVLVSSVEEDSPASRAGLRAGDVIVRFGDEEVEDPGDLRDAVREVKAGPVPMTVIRRGSERILTVEVPETASVGEGWAPWRFPGLRVLCRGGACSDVTV